MDGRRFYNPSDWESYMRIALGDDPARAQEGESTREERMFERVMMGLRQIRGIDCLRFAFDFGSQPEEIWPEAIGRFTREGLLMREGERLRLTQRGMQVMNSVLVEFL
jgi:oxygen-independent coproporphyrinogen-3 oxidase